MKITIISDIKGEAESIIPYGLHLAKDLDAEVDVIHVLDSRVLQGTTSVYADSQSVTPGTKMSHDEIMQRDKQQITTELNKLLSSEASRLNYPLKINVKVEENTIKNKIIGDLNSEPSSLLIMNMQADGHNHASQKEIVESSKDFNGMCLLVPPKYGYQKISSILLPTDFTLEEFDSYVNVADFLQTYRPVVNAVGKANGKKQDEIEQWKIDLSKVFIDSSINHKVIESNNFDDDFIEYIEMLEPSLTVIFERPQGFLSSMFKKELFEKVLKKTSFPVLFHSSKH